MTFEDRKELFLEEAADILRRIEEALVALERAPGDGTLVDEVFRGLHTIKGSGSMFGFTDIAEFAHHVENFFDEVRKGEIRASSAAVDVGLRAADCIKDLLAGGDGGPARALVLAAVDRIEGTKEGGAGSKSETASLPDIPRVFRIAWTPGQQILRRGIRVESIFRELDELGDCHRVAILDAVPDIRELDPTSLHLRWTITLSTTASLEAIKSVFIFVEEHSLLSFSLLTSAGPESEGATPRLGEILVDRGLLASSDVDDLRSSQKPLGEIAIDRGKVKREQVEAALAEQVQIQDINTEFAKRRESSTVRVRKEKLDRLMDLAGELVILEAIIEQEAKKQGLAVFQSLSETLARLSFDLRDAVMEIRMVPLDECLGNFRRLVRDLARSTGKELTLEIEGGQTELDKNVIELLQDPLMHIIRNAVDHGIEEPELRENLGKRRAGRISIAARHVGTRVEIAIADDGAGLDIRRIRDRAVERGLLDPAETDEARIMGMIFEPGFSTAVKTTDLSGRGVGMDVVKRNIERLRGEVTLESEAGRGMTAVLSIPLTLVMAEGLLVEVAGNGYVILLSQIEECLDLDESADASGDGAGVIDLRGSCVPLLSLRDRLGIDGDSERATRAVIVNHEGIRVGLEVDAVIGKKQVVIKPLSGAARRIKKIVGATILGDGSVALILDIPEIIKERAGDHRSLTRERSFV